ncbi:hypothetical protein BOTNAR_0561g00050 [Botryotinia narcissicola]|uniref:Uncharacterized protein n=1 Tax=Botryotinia narcissicola TaxID=278944 RepID=A0A4Z1HD45_9HELO|nr:hypothetical protein BOTNAR_0561g00050 [Botryotinia narcissicola]
MAQRITESIFTAVLKPTLTGGNEGVGHENSSEISGPSVILAHLSNLISRRIPFGLAVFCIYIRVTKRHYS